MSTAESMPSENSPQRDESALDSARADAPLEDSASTEAAVEGTIEPAPGTALARPDRALLRTARAKGLDPFPRVARPLVPVLQTLVAKLKHLDRMVEIVGEEARERRENGQAIQEFVAEDALKTGECLYGDLRHPIPAARRARREVFCSDEHRARYRATATAVVAGYKANDAAREAEIFRSRVDARAEVEDAEEQIGRASCRERV